MGLFSLRTKKGSTDDSVFPTSSQDETGAPRPRKRAQKSTEPIDPVLPEKKRARRRLLGAVALVLAAVIGLPMILDSEPKPLAEDIAIDIPSRDKQAPKLASASVAPPNSLDKREEIMTPAPLAGSASLAPSTKPAPVASLADAKTGVNPPAPMLPVKSETKEERKPAEHEFKREPVADKVKSGSERPERYVVQVAALASAEKVADLQNKLKAAGIKSYTQKVATQSGQRIRVRVGPLANKTEAEKMQNRLSKIGLNGTLVPA